MPFLNRVDRRIWWLTVSKAVDRSSNISNADLEAVLASLRSSTTESKAVSVECPLLKPDWLLSRRLFCVRKEVTWLNTTRSSLFAMKGRRETGLLFPKEIWFCLYNKVLLQGIKVPTVTISYSILFGMNLFYIKTDIYHGNTIVFGYVR